MEYRQFCVYAYDIFIIETSINGDYTDFYLYIYVIVIRTA